MVLFLLTIENEEADIVGITAAPRAAIAIAFVACPLLAGALCGCLTALGECPPDDQSLADGGEVDGLAPDRILAPLIGDHVATLTWSLPNRTTTMHLDIEQVGTTTVMYDCADHFGGFEVDVKAHLFTDDRLIDETSTDTTLRIDVSGHVTDPSWPWRLDIAPFRSSGVVPPSLDKNFDVEIATPTLNLKPVDGTIETTSQYAVPAAAIGTFHFLT